MRKTHNTPLFWLLVVFLLPILLSTALYYYHSYFQFKTTNHGELVGSPFDVKYLYASESDSNKSLWHIVYIDRGECDQNCRQVAYQLNQVRKALGNASPRVEVMQINAKDSRLNPMQTAFDQVHNKHVALENKIFLVDPLGNCFMYYPASTNPMNVLKDMKKVLEVSQIG